MTDSLSVDRADHVVTLTLRRPEVLNALDEPLMAALFDTLGRCAEDDDVRAVVLAGEGRAFCAGADVSRIVQAAAEGGPARGAGIRRGMAPSIRLATRLLTFEKPLVAAVHGIAAGAGASIAVACDVVVMGPDASISFIFPKRGLVPDYGASWTVPRLVGMRTAQRLLLTGERVGAEEAVAMGLASEVAEGDVLQAARARAEEMAAGPGLATQMTKRLLMETMQAGIAEQVDREFSLQALALGTEDAIEGGMSFLEKRPPRFRWA